MSGLRGCPPNDRHFADEVSAERRIVQCRLLGDNVYPAGREGEIVDDTHRGGADGSDTPATHVGPVLPSSRFGAGYTVGERADEPASAPPGWPERTASGRSSPPPPPEDPHVEFHRQVTQHIGGEQHPVVPGSGVFTGRAAPTHDPTAGTSPWGSAIQPGSATQSGFPPKDGHYVGTIPPSRPRRSIDVVLVVAAVVIACVSFLAGRLMAPKTPVPAAAFNPDTPVGGPAGGASTTAPVMPPSTGVTVTDPAGDAVPNRQATAGFTVPAT